MSFGCWKWLKYDRRADPIIGRWFVSSLSLSFLLSPLANALSMTCLFLHPHAVSVSLIYTHSVSFFRQSTLKLCGRLLWSTNLVTEPHGVMLPLDWWILSMHESSLGPTHSSVWLCHLHWQMYCFIITGNKHAGIIYSNMVALAVVVAVKAIYSWLGELALLTLTVGTCL